ncbi:hypothetical protein, partial [Methylobacterium radiotolerans]|uniref:hypothetical protein n=1 Tax=Methylobacterium radiotolerans TaxID=31998 RepID=UPI001AECAAAA
KKHNKKINASEDEETILKRNGNKGHIRRIQMTNINNAQKIIREISPTKETDKITIKQNKEVKDA